MTGEIDIDRRFDYHPPRSNLVTSEFVRVRQHVKALAEYLAEVLPTSREQALAITHLEEAHMWANAAIARNQDEVEKRIAEDTARVREAV